MKAVMMLGVVGLLLLSGCSDRQTLEQKQELCHSHCLSDNWQYGDWAGLNYCNCYNNTLNEVTDGKKT